jgi:tetratricopeptide (TPR) repeat protein
MQLGDLSGESDVRLGVERLLSEGRIEEALLFLFNLAMSLASENPSLALERFDEAIALAQGLGSESSLWGSRAGRLQMLCELGWFEEVLSEAESILAWATHAGDSWMTTLVWLSIAAVEIQRGGSRVDVDALADLVRGALPPHALEPVATLAHARGDDLRARALLTEAATSPARRMLPHIARHAVDFGLNDLAEELLARSGEDTSPIAKADRAAAAAALAESSGRITEAISGYRSAVRSYEAHGRIVRKAQCLQDLGRSLYALGDTDEGTLRLRESRRLWLEMGAGLRITEIDGLLSNPASNGGAA